MNTEETTMDVTYYDRHGRVTTPPQGPTLTITPTLPPGAVGYRVLVPATHVVARPRLRCRNRRAWLRSITRSGWRMVARVTL